MRNPLIPGGTAVCAWDSTRHTLSIGAPPITESPHTSITWDNPAATQTSQAYLPAVKSSFVTRKIHPANNRGFLFPVRRNRNPIWPFTEEQRIINRCAMQELPKTIGPERLLRVSTQYFTAGAVWQKISGAWSCTHAAPILHWMKGINPDQAKLALLKMGAHYQFLDHHRNQNKPLNGQSLPSRGGVHSEPQRRSTEALGTADPLDTVDRTPTPSDRAITALSPRSDSPGPDLKPQAHPVTTMMTTESPRVLACVSCA